MSAALARGEARPALRSARELYLGSSWPPFIGALPVELSDLEKSRELWFEDVAFSDASEVTAHLPEGRWRRTKGDDTVYRRTDVE